MYVSCVDVDGIVYVNEVDVDLRREEIKQILVWDYQMNQYSSDKFIDEFANQDELKYPSDLYFYCSTLWNEDWRESCGILFSFLYTLL